jgi:hypothetical protein
MTIKPRPYKILLFGPCKEIKHAFMVAVFLQSETIVCDYIDVLSFTTLTISRQSGPWHVFSLAKHNRFMIMQQYSIFNMCFKCTS